MTVVHLVLYAMPMYNCMPIPQEKLVSLSLTSDQVWSLWCNKDGEYSIKCAAAYRSVTVPASVLLGAQSQFHRTAIIITHILIYWSLTTYLCVLCSGSVRTSPWQQVFLEENVDDDLEVPQDCSDVKEYYLQDIFTQGKFTVPAIAKALNVSRSTLHCTVKWGDRSMLKKSYVIRLF